mmetsp:Transcript_115453/g.326315  ORF Transcript_115453/g.326315 Transcript_115453/m.326315 type:complete len:222 (+) Transcript_115453:561-1226(+)
MSPKEQILVPHVAVESAVAPDEVRLEVPDREDMHQETLSRRQPNVIAFDFPLHQHVRPAVEPIQDAEERRAFCQHPSDEAALSHEAHQAPLRDVEPFVQPHWSLPCGARCALQDGRLDPMVVLERVREAKSEARQRAVVAHGPQTARSIGMADVGAQAARKFGVIVHRFTEQFDAPARVRPSAASSSRLDRLHNLLQVKEQRCRCRSWMVILRYVEAMHEK